MTETQLATIWKNVLSELELQFSQTIYKTWFKDTKLTKLEPRLAEITVDNDLTQKFIKKYAEERIVANLSRQVSFPVTTITYLAKGGGKRNKNSVPVFSANLFDQEQSPSTSTPSPTTNPIQSHESQPVASNLNPKYTFDSFIVGNRNRLAHAAAKAVAAQPGKMYNPLYLYGGVGLGKTHLMQAVGNEIIRREPQRRILYISCENFLNEYVTSIRTNKMDAFKKKYRNIDVFLVDDIQFIGGKDGVQEEFFHTFNALYQTDKQIIITSDKTPSEISGLEERLSSRFSSGMIADMQLPDQETREAILMAKCEEKGINLSPQIIHYVAELVETNIRELEGALTTVLVHLAAGDTTPTLEDVQQMLKAFSLHKPPKKTSFEQIKDVICEFYGVTFEELVGPRRQKELVKPRQVLMYLMKHELGMTFPTIGREIGGRDHTTAMHSVEKIEKEMKKLPETRDEMQRIKELYYAGSRG